MNFDEFWKQQVANGQADIPTAKNVAMFAWDAALCAAQHGSRERGELKDALAISAVISNLHTWNTPVEGRKV